MSKDTSESTNIGFSDIESFVRERALAFIQSIIEEEVEEFLGRRKSERRAVDTPSGYRNGHGDERRLTTSIGTVKVRRPRVRATDEQFVSRLLPLLSPAYRRGEPDVAGALLARALNGRL